MRESWAPLLTRWTEASLIDEATAARIRAFELEHARSARLRWPVWVALAFGGLMIAAGVLLFVSAHWDILSPAARFALVIVLVALFHVAAAATAERFPGMATTLHTVGTATLGAGIFLAGQIFNLEEHWPGGLMLWALGAAIGWALLRQWPQAALAAILAPAWLTGEWAVATERDFSQTGARVAACGVFLLALTYFTAIRTERADTRRPVLFWLGAIALLPAAGFLAAVSAPFRFGPAAAATTIAPSLRALGWSSALGLPLALAIALRRAAAWPNAVALLWVVVLVNLDRTASLLPLYAWWALGAIALVGWGVREARTERINMGSAIFAATVLTFYFSQVMDKLGRSLSLVGFGLLFLAGGWALERIRRRLVQQTRGERA